MEVPSAQFFPHGFEGRLEMQNSWVPAGEVPMADDFCQFNLACRPFIELKIVLCNDVYTGNRQAISYEEAEQAVSSSLPPECMGKVLVRVFQKRCWCSGACLSRRKVSMPDAKPTLGGLCTRVDACAAHDSTSA
ncbi:Pla2g4d [Symbiodinium natans]|uniref:Pla2g4d protein n=1 Tax=Symbiodinium natans TaxID=878477 RepID=A0A812U9H0_9DINO|nr:Pla2g4d [Symbiodinium natans]